jgi:hypothetical protein
MTRQRKYQLAHQRRGLCILCPRVAFHGGIHCRWHTMLQRQRNRAKYGLRPWRPGGLGRPPLSAQRHSA